MRKIIKVRKVNELSERESEAWVEQIHCLKVVIEIHQFIHSDCKIFNLKPLLYFDFKVYVMVGNLHCSITDACYPHRQLCTIRCKPSEAPSISSSTLHKVSGQVIRANE